MGNTRQILRFSLTAIGALIVAAPYIVNSGYLFLFLVAPLFLYGLALTFLRYMFLHIEVVAHLKHVVTPRIKSNLRELCPDELRDLTDIMSWEHDAGYKGPLDRYSVLYWPIPAAPLGVPLLAALVSLCGYCITICKLHVSITWAEYGLICINLIGLTYLVIVSYLVGRRKVKTSDTSQRSNIHLQPTTLKGGG